MGITPWVVRHPTSPVECSELAKLEHDVAQCTRCPLHQTRSQTVFARGHATAKLMIIGEAPGFHEDKQGLPFVGAAGGLLDKMVASIGLEQDHIYIANVLKCRPPNNRDPEIEEIAQCGSYLAQQIMLIQPTLIIALGRFAGQYILNSTDSLSKLRARSHEYQGIKVIVSYHPAYLLRNPADKKKAYQDWMDVKKTILSK
ncbi:MAG: uracil-DNA glycosylase [Legionella sp.]|nr:MAG: uracil-DNA glycosylase [Legionella sp.]